MDAAVWLCNLMYFIINTKYKYTVTDTKKQEVTDRGDLLPLVKKMRGERIQINEKLFTMFSISRNCENNVFKV